MLLLPQLQHKIEYSLPGAKVHLIDHSADHAEHNPSGAHIEIQVTYSGFAGKSILEQHQMIYNILKEEMKEQIHALKIKTTVG